MKPGVKSKALLAILVAIAGFATTVGIATLLLKREYRAPIAAPVAAHEETPRVQGLADQAAEQEKSDKEKPYVEADYRPFPKVGSRVAIWVVAELHLLFAAFVLAVPTRLSIRPRNRCTSGWNLPQP